MVWPNGKANLPGPSQRRHMARNKNVHAVEIAVETTATEFVDFEVLLERLRIRNVRSNDL
jgi:hypothetical protein